MSNLYMFAWRYGRSSEDRVCFGALPHAAGPGAHVDLPASRDTRLFFVHTETTRTKRDRETVKQISGEMQKELCLAFLKFYPFVEVSLVVDEKTAFMATMDQPLLYVSEGKAIEATFARQTDMSRIDKCFSGQPSFDEDMRDSSAGSE